MGSGVVGDLTYNNVSFKTPAPLYDGFLIIVNIPEEARAPMPQDFDCVTAYPISQDDMECRINGQRITITVAIDPASPAERIAIGEDISLRFSQIRNPPSTYPTQDYEIEIRTHYYQIVASQRTGGAPIINNEPAVVQDFDFAAFDLRQLVTTTVTLQWRNTQVYPADLALLIHYNPDEIKPDIEEGENTVPCIFRNMVALTCEYPEDQPGVIKVTDLLAAEQSPGLLLTLTLT